MITESYARENNLDIEDTIDVSISDQADTIEINGLFETVEHAYLVKDPNKSLISDHKVKLHSMWVLLPVTLR